MNKPRSFLQKIVQWRTALTPRLIAYLFIILVAQSLVLYGALKIIAVLPQEITGVEEDYKFFHDAYRGPIGLITEKLTGDIEKDQALLKSLTPLFGYPVTLTAKKNIDKLPSYVRMQFSSSTIAFDPDTYIFYSAYPASDQYFLEVGPVVRSELVDSNSAIWVPFIFLWSFISIIVFLLLLVFAFAPLWRDAMVLRKCAETLASGEMKVTDLHVQSWLFKPLAKIIANMAQRVELLVHDSKVLSHAMAHELRTPIARMRFGLTLLEESDSQAEQQEKLKGVYQDIDELEALIKVSLDFFHMQQHEIVLHKKNTTLTQWNEAICHDLLPLRPDHIEFIQNIENKTFSIDAKILTIAINNLLLNAFKYSASLVMLSMSYRNQNLVIEVDDNGTGIPVEDRERIFTPFSRLDSSRAKKTGGYGLGLAYAKLVADYHSGFIEVLNSPLGGAQFRLTIAVDGNSGAPPDGT